MRQAVLLAPKKIEFREVPAPKAEDLKGNEILLNIKKIGICGSEIHSYHGLHPATFYPVVQGHEYSGVVVAVGPDVKDFKPGNRVTARPQLVCGTCNPCKRGDVIIVGVHAKDPQISMFYLGEHELNLIGSMMYRHEDYLKAVEEIAKGTIKLAPLVSNRFPLDRYDEAYRFIDANRETCMKVIVDLEA